MKDKKSLWIKAVSVVAALMLWQGLSAVVDSKVLLVSPLDVIKRLSVLVTESEFFSVLGFSFCRIALGFFLGTFCGIVLALTAGKFKVAETLLWPYMLTIKSVPVASFVVIALIWLNGSNLSVFISFLMVLPIIYTNLLDGIKSIDGKMLEMASVFKIPFFRRLRFIWLPSVKPFLFSGARISLGLAWKSGIAAELIGYPEGSVGEALYYSKLYLATEDLFAWTVVIVLASVAFEKLVIWLLKGFYKAVEAV